MKFNKGISTLAIIFIVIIGIVLVSMIARRVIINRGISSYESAYKEKQEELCSNSQYSTEVSLQYGVFPRIDKAAIALDKKSEGKLEETIKEQGNSALESINDLNCLEALMVETTISDVSPLSGLKNIKFLSLNLKSGTDISPVSDLENLVLLYLDGSKIENLFSLSNLDSLEYLELKSPEMSEECKDLKEDLSGVEISCSE